MVSVRPLRIERVSERLGFDWVCDRVIGRPQYGPYLFVVTVIVVHLPLLSIVGWMQTGVLSLAVNPGEVFQIVAWPAVVWILLRTKAKYERAVNELPEPIDDDVMDAESGGPLSAWVLNVLDVPAAPDGKSDVDLETLVHPQVRYAILLPGLALYGVQLVVNPSGLVGPVAELTGQTVATIRFYVIIPFVLYPIGAELLATVVGALVLLPLKIERARLVDFSDPHGFAGLSPAGELFKSVTISYFILVTLFAVFQTVAVGAQPTDLFSSTLLIAGVAVGIGLFFGPMLWIKSYLATAKDVKIDALADASRQVGSTDELFPYAEPESPATASEYTYNHIQMQQVRATSEFPLNFAMIQEVLFALVLPYATSLLFDMLLQGLR